MKTVLLCFLFCIIPEHVSSGCKSSSSQNVTFNSRNFIYILQWNNKDVDPNATFSVQYKWYGDKMWLMKKGCQNITRLYCNLTDEISGDLDKLKEFFGRVKAMSNNCSLDWVMSKRLDPREDTHIDNLEFGIIENVRSAKIFVQVPSLLINTTFSQQNNVEFYLNFGNTEEVTREKIQTHNIFNVTGLNPNTKYNGSVYIKINHKRKSDIKKFVFKTLHDPPVLGLLVSILLSAGLLSLGLLYLCCRYTKQHRKTPKALVFDKPPTFQATVLTREKENSLHPVPVQLKEQWLGKCEVLFSNTVQHAYKSQFENPPAEENNNPLPTSFSCVAHQEETISKNKEIDQSINYGVFEDRTADARKPFTTKNLGNRLENPQEVRHLTSHQQGKTLLANDTGKELNEPLMLEFPVKNSDFSLLHTLLSTVEVCYSMEQDEKPDSSLQSNVNEFEDLTEFDNCFSNKTAKTLDNSLLPFAGNYKRSFQIPVNYTRPNSLGNISHCQQPYRQQQ